MRQLRWIVVTLAFALSVGGSGQTSFRWLTVSAQEKVDPATITVYVTRTGGKYHRDGCRYLRRSRIPMSLREAARRFGPCSVCRPPVPQE
jgi:hypothetical protein